MEKIEEWVKASYGLKVVPQRITKKATKKQDIDRIVKHAIEEIYGKE